MQFVDLILLHLFVAKFPFPFVFIVLMTNDSHDDECDYTKV